MNRRVVVAIFATYLGFAGSVACSAKDEATTTPQGCITATEASEQAQRLVQEAGAKVDMDPDPVVGLWGPKEIVCSGTWAVIENVGFFMPDDTEQTYPHWWGPVLLRWNENRWTGVSIALLPFDGGRACELEGCTDDSPTNAQQCRQAPPELRARMMNC